MDTRTHVLEMTRMLEAGQVLPALDRFYDKNIEVSAIGAEERLSSGKSAGFSNVYNWFMNSLLHLARVEFLAIDGDHAAIELFVDITPAGDERHLERIVMLQTWQDGRIIRTTNYAKRVAD